MASQPPSYLPTDVALVHAHTHALHCQVSLLPEFHILKLWGTKEPNQLSHISKLGNPKLTFTISLSFSMILPLLLFSITSLYCFTIAAFQQAILDIKVSCPY